MKTTYIYTIIALLMGSAFMSACKKKTAAPNFHYAYFGLEAGRYVIYDVVDITHDAALSQHDTVRYQMKTYWGDVYVDNEGREGREYIIFKRTLSSDPWGQTDVWHGLFDGIRGELVEENVRNVKLVFAPTLSKEWDANAYNMNSEITCYYRDIHQDTTINGVLLDSTLVVEQKSYANLIDSVRMYETYAKNIGLVYKHFRDNHYQFGSDEVVNGRELYMTYVSAGIE